MTLGQAVTPLVGILVLAAVVEALVEYLAAPIVAMIYASVQPDRKVPESLPALRYVSMIVGIVLCVVYSADLLALADLTTSVPFVGAVVTGMLIGRGANFVNDFASRWLVRPK